MLPSASFISKRDVLQSSSQIYDPLGWATPVTIKAKILLQKVWQRKTKLELMAAVMGTRLATFIQSSLTPHSHDPPI